MVRPIGLVLEPWSNLPSVPGTTWQMPGYLRIFWVVDVFREGLPLSTANTKFPKIVCPEGLQDGLARPGRRTLKGDLERANVESTQGRPGTQGLWPRCNTVVETDNRFLHCH